MACRVLREGSWLAAAPHQMTSQPAQTVFVALSQGNTDSLAAVFS